MNLSGTISKHFGIGRYLHCARVRRLTLQCSQPTCGCDAKVCCRIEAPDPLWGNPEICPVCREEVRMLIATSGPLGVTCPSCGTHWKHGGQTDTGGILWVPEEDRDGSQ